MMEMPGLLPTQVRFQGPLLAQQRVTYGAEINLAGFAEIN
jgi:hypothetical protein